MNKIIIKDKNEVEDSWHFRVEVGDDDNRLEYSVSLKKDYWQKLTKGEEDPENLIKRSFEFLLEREPKESILKKFDLSVIGGYFEEYEDKIKL